MFSQLFDDRTRRSFVRLATWRLISERLIRTILMLAEEFGLHTVAEGVENLEQWRILKDLGCAACQGYHFGSPQPVDQLLAFLNRNVAIAMGRESVD